jgi:hypothetical protein
MALATCLCQLGTIDRSVSRHALQLLTREDVVDTRLPDDKCCVMTIEDAHERAINSVNWRPSHEMNIVTASFDQVKLHDLRHKQATALSCRASGHNIFHPLFVGNGHLLVIAGADDSDGMLPSVALMLSEIQLFGASQAKIISRGALGFKPTTLAASSEHTEWIAAAYNGGVAFLMPSE